MGMLERLAYFCGPERKKQQTKRLQQPFNYGWCQSVVFDAVCGALITPLVQTVPSLTPRCLHTLGHGTKWNPYVYSVDIPLKPGDKVNKQSINFLSNGMVDTLIERGGCDQVIDNWPWKIFFNEFDHLGDIYSAPDWLLAYTTQLETVAPLYGCPLIKPLVVAAGSRVAPVIPMANDQEIEKEIDAYLSDALTDILNKEKQVPVPAQTIEGSFLGSQYVGWCLLLTCHSVPESKHPGAHVLLCVGNDEEALTRNTPLYWWNPNYLTTNWTYDTGKEKLVTKDEVGRPMPVKAASLEELCAPLTPLPELPTYKTNPDAWKQYETIGRLMWGSDLNWRWGGFSDKPGEAFLDWAFYAQSLTMFLFLKV
jgi:hypothetical protein